MGAAFALPPPLIDNITIVPLATTENHPATPEEREQHLRRAILLLTREVYHSDMEGAETAAYLRCQALRRKSD